MIATTRHALRLRRRHTPPGACLAAAGAVLSLLLVAPLPAAAGDARLAAGEGTWTPSGCALPASPDLTIDDAEAINRMLAELSRKIAAYNACVAAEAAADMAAANRLIGETATRLQQDALALFEATRQRMTAP